MKFTPKCILILANSIGGLFSFRKEVVMEMSISNLILLI